VRTKIDREVKEPYAPENQGAAFESYSVIGDAAEEKTQSQKLGTNRNILRRRKEKKAHERKRLCSSPSTEKLSLMWGRGQ